MPRSAIRKLRLQGVPCARGPGPGSSRPKKRREGRGGPGGRGGRAGNSPGRESCAALLPNARGLLPLGFSSRRTPCPSWPRTFLVSALNVPGDPGPLVIPGSSQNLPGLGRGSGVGDRPGGGVPGLYGNLSQTSLWPAESTRPPSHPTCRTQTVCPEASGSLCQGSGKKKESGVIRCLLPESQVHCDL